MEMSGQLHEQAALHPDQEPPVPILREAGWFSEPVWTLWWKKNTTIAPAGNLTPVILAEIPQLSCRWKYNIKKDLKKGRMW